MGIRFSCPACGRSLNVKAELAGKRGRCPHCQGKIVIPSDDASAGEPATAETTAKSDTSARRQAASSDTAAYVRPEDMPTVVNRAPAGLLARIIPAKTAEMASSSAAATPATMPAAGQPAVSAAPLDESAVRSTTTSPAAAHDAISEAPQLQWYVMPPGATSQYGPAAGQEFRIWIAEGRVTGDSLVWRQDWPEWKRADAVFAQLQGTATAQAPAPAAMPAIPVAGALPVGSPIPAAGGLPIGQIAHPLVGPPGGVFTAGAFPGVANDGFAVASDNAATVSRRSSRPYRPRSNSGPMIVIIVLLLAMIPLSYFVYKVVSEQLAPGTTAKTAAKTDKSKTTADEIQSGAKDEPASSPNEAEE